MIDLIDLKVQDYLDKGEHAIVIANVDLWDVYPDIEARAILGQGYIIYVQQSTKDFSTREYRIPFSVVSDERANEPVQAGIPILSLILGVLGLLALWLVVSEIRKTAGIVITPIEDITEASKSYFPYILILLGIVFLPKLMHEVKS